MHISGAAFMILIASAAGIFLGQLTRQAYLRARRARRKRRREEEMLRAIAIPPSVVRGASDQKASAAQKAALGLAGTTPSVVSPARPEIEQRGSRWIPAFLRSLSRWAVRLLGGGRR